MWIENLLRELGEGEQVSGDADQLEHSFIDLLTRRYNSIPPQYKRELEHFMNREAYERLRRARTVRGRGRDESVYDFTPCDEMRVIFIHVPKTAGESVAYSLFGTMGIGHVGAESLHRVLGPDFWDFFIFTFVRNPFSRLVSAYEYLRAGGHPAWENNRRFSRKLMAMYPTFGEFVAHMISVNADFPGFDIPHFRPQTDLVSLDGRLIAHFTGHFETLERDVRSLGAQLGREIVLQRRNVSERRERNVADYFREEPIKDMVVDFYRRDFEAFGYSFDPRNTYAG